MMRSLTVLPLLCSVFIVVQFAQAQVCNLDGAKRDVDFPDLETEGIESFQMAVEYTAPDAKQTDYYVEYYDILERRGRVDGHQAGNSESYLYYTDTSESWTLTSKECTYKNITQTPKLLRSDMTEWWYVPPQDEDDKRVFGPSAMFKYALAAWNSTERKTKMAYMGKTEGLVRGLKAQYWRRCDTPTTYIDYFFTTDDEEDPLGVGLKKIPLRVYFGGKRVGVEAEMSKQQYEIITFQPFISTDVQPFQLPKGRECKRGFPKELPQVPDFSDKNLQFSAEVVYRKVDFSGNDVQYWSYYSTLKMSWDLQTQFLAYYYTPWNETKPGEEPIASDPEYVIYDMKHGYAYKTNIMTGKCQIDRRASYVPKFKLPNNAGAVSLTDPAILFPNSELTFISEGTNRGLKVNIFEEIVENYILDTKDNRTTIPKAVVTHSYLKDDEVMRNTVSVKNALTQVLLKFTGREDKVVEILTLNFFGFTTQINKQRFSFNTLRCFKNEDMYSWVTIGFNADQAVLEVIKDEVPAIQAELLTQITMHSELNAVRIPFILVDINDGLFASMLILEKPPVFLDYLDPEKGKTITGSTEVEGIQDPQACATKCLESENNCWGFSMCGALCIFGATPTATVKSDSKCELYMRYNNESYIPSKEQAIQNLRREVETHNVKLVLKGKDSESEPIQLEATSIEVTNPGEDDYIFNFLGHEVDPRMRVMKAGGKLKGSSGSPVKNMGKLRFDECQKLCLDFKECETLSYCLTNSDCVLSRKYGDDLGKDEIEDDNMCSVMTRKYADHFGRSPGNVLSITAAEVQDLDTVEKCARACLKSSKFQCLSFDHCPQDAKGGCKLHTVHHPNSKTRESIQVKSTNCGHYYRKYSTEFKKSQNKRIIGGKLAPITNLTLEECSKSCMEYGQGTCFGFDFCQDSAMFATSCILFDSDPAQLKSAYSDICTNYVRSEPQFAPRPYTTGYTGGIGFLCFLIGLIVGCAVVFGIAYIRVNRRG